MTDQIPADKVREIIHVNTFRRVVLPHCRASIIDQLEALLFRHSLPTLADMTDAERRECRWMQCDVIGWSERPVIVPLHHDNGTAMVMCENGTNDTLDTRQIIPRPDLPRLEWPGGQKPAPATALPDGWRLADHKDHGRVIVTTQTPNDDGRVYFVLPVCRNLMGFDWRACDPAELTYIDQEADTVPPDTLAVGTVIESADDPRIAALPPGSILLDRDDEATIKLRWAWTGLGYSPAPWQGSEFGPWTVLHIPKEGDR